MLGQYLKMGHDRFLPHDSEIIIHNRPPVRRYAVSAVENKQSD